jgi:peptide deformylase
VALLRIVTVEDNDAVLRKRAEPVKKFTPKVRRLVRNLIETMQEAPGVGLAAPQVGISQRIIVIDVPEEEGQPLAGKPFALINPRVEPTSSETEEGMEGCLSVPGLVGEVMRPTTIHVRARNEWGKPLDFQAGGFVARVIQHEADHLEGILFVDRTDKVYEITSEDEESEGAVDDAGSERTKEMVTA